MRTHTDITAQIKEKSHAVVPFPVTQKEFQDAIDVFVEFLKLPLETKEQFYDKLIHMKKIHDAAVETLGGILQTIETQIPGIHERLFPKEGIQHFYVRFLKYDRATPGSFLAKGHYDRGACTLALAESAPGLRMGIDDLHLNEVTHKEGEALFMPAIKFLPEPHPDFPPTWHDVIQKGEDVYSDDIARWAIVFFANGADNVKITYEDAHTPKRI